MDKNAILELIKKCYLDKERVLRLDDCELTDSDFKIGSEIRSVLESCRHLVALSLINNRLAKIEGFRNLTNLTYLNISNNQISEINNLENLTKLQILNLTANRITEIKGLDSLTALLELNLAANGITKIEGLKNLVSLENLSIDNNHITEITGIENLISLKKLHLRSNKIKKINSLVNLRQLEELNLQANQITELEGLSGLVSLQKLHLGGNQIGEIKGLDNLNNLKKIDLGSNKITSIKPILSFPSFKNNKLNVFTGRPNFPETSEIFLDNNPLTLPPIEIVQNGRYAILNYFLEVEKAGIDYLYEAKMLIVGQPRAGKTSLRLKLFDINATLPEDDKTTRGIDITRLKFNFTDKKSKISEFKYNIWDFGGQQIYQSTHQFFLTHRSLYVLVIDTAKDTLGNDDSTVNYWLQAVELLGGKSPLLLVRNEKGQRKIQLDMSQKRARFPFLRKDYSIDLNALIVGTATYNENRVTEFEILKEDIENELKHLPLVGFAMPKNWVSIRNKLHETSKNTPYISKQDYTFICTQFEVTDFEKQMELSRIFHDLGVFLHFQSYAELDNFIILQNTWATDAVFTVFDNGTVQNNNGRFTDFELPAIWQSKGYPKEVHRSLVALMKQFELCYEVDKADRTLYIVPEMLPDKAPDAYSWYSKKDLLLQYRYDFMPRGLLTRLIVRLHRFISTENNRQVVWKTGVKIDGILLDCPDTYTEITEAWNNKQINIKTQGVFAKELMTKVAHEIDRLNGDFFRQLNNDDDSQHSRWYKMIPCNCTTCMMNEKKHFYDYQKLLSRKQFGKIKIECEVPPHEEVSISDLIEGVINSSHRRGYVKGEKKIFISYSKKDVEHINRFNEHLASLKLDGKVSSWYCTLLEAGSKWDAIIQDHFDTCDIACFMISPHFISTPYIRENEIKKAFERKAKDPAFKIVPIILDFCNWTTDQNNLADFTALPYTGKPVVDFKNQNMAWYLIETCLRAIINKDLNPTGPEFYTSLRTLPADVLRHFERIVTGASDL